MSVHHHRPSRKAQRSPRKPAIPAVSSIPLEATLVTFSGVPVEQEAEVNGTMPRLAPLNPELAPEAAAKAAANETAGATPAGDAGSHPDARRADRQAALVEQHFARISELIAKAEYVAGQLLDALLTRVQRREQVYPGELVHICRGLHALARCSAELARALGRSSAARLTTAQVAQLEARLKKAFGL